MESHGGAILIFLALYKLTVTTSYGDCLKSVGHKCRNAINSLSLQLPKETFMKIVKFAAQGRETVYLFHVREQFRTFP